jgi:hypothetical protein
MFYVVAQTSGGAREVINGSIRTNHFVVKTPSAAGSHRLGVDRCRLRPDIPPRDFLLVACRQKAEMTNIRARVQAPRIASVLSRP